MIEDLELKLNGNIPVTKEELKYLVSSWGYTKGYFGKTYEETIGKNYFLDKLDVSQIKDLSQIFTCSKFNGDISNWNVSNCENMNMMFQSSLFNGDISKWNISNVKTMYMMFHCSKFNGDISNWDVSNVTNMVFLFASSPFNRNISKWNVSNVEDMSFMFELTVFDKDISKWNPIKLIKNVNMFDGNKVFEKKHKRIFNYYKNLNIYKKELFNKSKRINDLIKGNIPIDKWELIQLINSWGRLNYSSFSLEVNVNFELKFNKDLKCYPLENLDVSQIEDFSMLFIGSMYNGDLSKWNVSNATNMNGMFSGSKFNNDSLKNWNISKVTNLGNIFEYSDFNGDISNWDVSNCNHMFAMFKNSNFDRDISKWNISKVTSFISMFENTNFSGDISSFDFKRNETFDYCKNIFKDNNKFKLLYNQNNDIPNNTKEFLEWFDNNKDFINLQYNLTQKNAI